MTETILISIPQRNMHTQVEVCDIRDIQSIVNMTVESIEEMVSGNYKML
jgi:putative aminopeptidase FrvX